MWAGMNAKKGFYLKRMAAVRSMVSLYLKAKSLSEIDPSICHILK